MHRNTSRNFLNLKDTNKDNFMSFFIILMPLFPYVASLHVELSVQETVGVTILALSPIFLEKASIS